MKNKLYLILAGLFLLTVQAKAQSPNSFNYQGVARDASGNVLANQAIGLEFTIYQGSATGTKVYEETQTETTNQFGLFTVSIGEGTVKSGTFVGIGWGANSEYLDVAMDPTGGSSYTDMGTQQLLSVPYALYAASSGNVYTAGTGISITDNVVSANTTDALWNANQLQGDSVSITAPTADQVLEWNGAAWAPTTAKSGWGLSGNSGTTYGTNFIGTTDDQGLQFEVNNNEAGKIEDASSANANTGIGYLSLSSNTGLDNVAVGFQSLNNNGSGSNNVGVGYGTLPSNATGSDITAIGSGADVIFDGLTNATAIGANAVVEASNTVQLGSGCSVQFDQALMPGGDPGSSGEILVSNGANTAPSWNLPSGWSLTGNYGTSYGTNYIGTNDAADLEFVVNGQASGAIRYDDNTTALGYESLTSGSNNSSFGYQAGQYTSGNDNTSVGSGSLYQAGGNDNTAVGYSAGYVNYGGGNNNTALGANALYVDYGGGGGFNQPVASSNNTAIGANALYDNNNAGGNNTIVGAMSMYEEGGGGGNPFAPTVYASNNTCVGYQTMYVDNGGNNNTYVGYQSANGNWSGSNNTGLGYNALNGSSSASYNVGVGYGTLITNSTGNYNTGLGYQANVSTDGLSNATAIGYNAVVGESNALVLGGTGGGAVNVGINTTTPNSSLQISGGNVSLPIVVSASGVDLSTSSLTYTVIITADGQTVNFPAAASCTGRVYIIVAQMASGSITTDSYINLNAAGTTSVSAGNSVTIQSDGTNWDQIR